MELINGNNQCIFRQNQEPFPIFKKGRGSLCFVSYMPAMCLLQCLVTLKGHHIILWAIQNGACHIKGNISNILWTITKIYLAKGLSSLEAISSWYSNSLWHQIAYISKHVLPFVLVSRGQMKREMGEGNRFHYVKSFQTRSFFWSVFSRILTE